MASNARAVTEVDEVREERLRRRECDRLRRERESNEERCARFVNLCPRLTALGSKDTNLTILLPSDNCLSMPHGNKITVLIIEQLLPFLLRAYTLYYAGYFDTYFQIWPRAFTRLPSLLPCN